MKNKILLGMLLLIAIGVFAESEVLTGSFEVGNSAPNQPTNFEIQDGASSWDSSGIDTHDVTPNIKWNVSDDNGDSVITYVCVANSTDNRNNGNCLYYTSTSNNYINSLTGLYYSGSNVTFYARLTPNDGTENGTALDTQFNIINNIPTTPSNLLPLSTHSQTPTLTWMATDADDGTVDKWPADTVTKYLRVGTSYGDGTYESNDNANNAGEVVSSTMPWGMPGSVDANATYYVQVWSVDSTGASSEKINQTLILTDNLPDITDVEITDGYSIYSSCVTSTCALNPIEHSNSSVAVRVTVTDNDNDCDTQASATISLCLDTSCTPATEDYGWELDHVIRDGSECVFTFSNNKTSGTPEFYVAPGTYKYYANVTSQAGARTSDAEREDDWTYGTLKAINYPESITFGDGTISLGEWNDGTSLATVTNWGNDILNLTWAVSNPTSGTDTWNLTGTDMMIDDDNSQSTESGPINPVYLDGTPRMFQPTAGLQRCTSYACDSGSNETLATYYHINPPLGLKQGIYNSTITITLS